MDGQVHDRRIVGVVPDGCPDLVLRIREEVAFGNLDAVLEEGNVRVVPSDRET